MFIVVKDGIGIEVACQKEELVVTPFYINSELNDKAKEVADEQSDAAIAYLEQQESKDSEQLLRTYFEGKGWKITDC
ncbi:MAG: hypothetical protein C4330_01065 [Chitinophagaceae bacterium]